MKYLLSLANWVCLIQGCANTDTSYEIRAISIIFFATYIHIMLSAINLFWLLELIECGYVGGSYDSYRICYLDSISYTFASVIFKLGSRFIIKKTILPFAHWNYKLFLVLRLLSSSPFFYLGICNLSPSHFNFTTITVTTFTFINSVFDIKYMT